LAPVSPDRNDFTACYSAYHVFVASANRFSIAALTVYDMCKSIDRGMTIEQMPARRKIRRPQRALAPRIEMVMASLRE
jgi:hypothetical protein